jgi:hypothetical protein
MKYMLNAYITVCECINILVIYNVISDMLNVINYIFFHYTITVCTLVWYDRTFMMHAANISGIMLFFT